jgi:hypothetical protein
MKAINRSYSLIEQLVILSIFTIIIKLIYANYFSLILGDALAYCGESKQLALGNISGVSPLWFGVHYLWIGFFNLFISGTSLACKAASFLPAILILIPMCWFSRILFSEKISWMIGLSIAVHPRLIEYSVNGYPTTFYLLLIAISIAFFILMLKKIKLIYSLGFGIPLGILFCSRAETITLFGMLVLWALFLIYFKEKSESLKEISNKKLLTRFILIPALSYALSISLLFGIINNISSKLGFFGKYSAVSKSTQIVFNSDQESSKFFVKQRLAKKNLETKKEKIVPKMNFFMNIKTLLVHFFNKGFIGTSAQFMLKTALTPLLLFFFYFIFINFKSMWFDLYSIPLLIIFVWPILFFSLFWSEPRHLFPSVLPVIILGSLGLEQCRFSMMPYLNKLHIKSIVILFVFLGGIAVSSWQNRRLNQKYGFQTELSNWVKINIEKESVFVGSPYGQGGLTSYMSERKLIHQLWTEDVKDFKDFVIEKKASWLIISEEYLKFANEEILSIIEDGVPGFEKVFEIKDGYDGDLTQVYRLKEI